jgi:hypothetical protein
LPVSVWKVFLPDSGVHCRSKRRLAPAAFQVLAVLGILACGVDAALIRFVHLSLAPLLDDFFDAASEPACAAILSIVAFCSLSESENENT